MEFVSDTLLKLPVPDIICQLPTDEVDSWRFRNLLVIGTETGLVLEYNWFDKKLITKI